MQLVVQGSCQRTLFRRIPPLTFCTLCKNEALIGTRLAKQYVCYDGLV